MQSWGVYLARGVQQQQQQQLQGDGGRLHRVSSLDASLAREMKARGYVLLELELHEEEKEILTWESTFARAFALTREEKEAGGVYRSLEGLSLGYRAEDEREFLETRLVRYGYNALASASSSSETKSEQEEAAPAAVVDAVVSPSYSPEYARVVMKITQVLNKAAVALVENLLTCMQLDPACIVDLTDCLEPCESVSSSLLRICLYPAVNSAAAAATTTTTTTASATTTAHVGTPTDKSDARVAFGSHTDTSFLTLGLCSSNPGLEVFCQESNTWISIEARANALPLRAATSSSSTSSPSPPASSSIRCVAFIGEFLQVLTRSHYKACVHRVRSPQNENRLSCPYIIRGKSKATIALRDTQKYAHGASDEQLQSITADLDGTTMKFLHKMLDFKRQKCLKANENNVDDWVLQSAF